MADAGCAIPYAALRARPWARLTFRMAARPRALHAFRECGSHLLAMACRTVAGAKLRPRSAPSELMDVRVLRRNLVYAVGLAPDICTDEVRLLLLLSSCNASVTN